MHQGSQLGGAEHTGTNGNDDCFKLQRAARRLTVAVELGMPLADALKISTEACTQLTHNLDLLAGVDWTLLTSDQVRKPYSYLRRQVRLIAACLVTDVPVDNRALLSQRTWALIGNESIIPADVERVLFGDARMGGNPEVPVATYRTIAEHIRAGIPQKQAARLAGVAERFGAIVGSFIGYDAWRRDVIIDDAVDVAEQGEQVSVSEFSRRHHISRDYARRLLAYGAELAEDVA